MTPEYYVRDCGCMELAGEVPSWCQAREPRPLSGLCFDCRKARIGETIEFVRFGNLPNGGRSYNHRDKTEEDGVSVYEVKGGVIQFVGFYCDFAERPAYRGKGVIVGWGSDGEPLVKPGRVHKVSATEIEAMSE